MIKDSRPVQPPVVDFAHGISAVDTEFKRPHMAASHLIVENGRAAIVDCGTNYSVPGILAALADKGIAPDQVDFLILTHVHLDHAGGAGLLMQQLPGATLIVHPRGGRHMVDPSRLVAGASAVYGKEEIAATYGVLQGVPAARIREVQDGEHVLLAGRHLEFWDTPGHARHHICVLDHASHSVFTGDTFGLSYREFDVEGQPFIFPTTTPVQFDPVAAHQSIDRIVAWQPQYCYLTHYAQVGSIPRLAASLHQQLDEMVALALREQDAGPTRHARLVEGLSALLLGRLRAHGCSLSDQEVLALLDMDLELNAQGLGVWLDQQSAYQAAS